MTEAEIHQILTEITHAELWLDGPLPAGDLALHLDSIQRLTLVVAIEDRFLICFEPEEEDAVRTLSDVVGIIQAKCNDSGGGAG